MSPIQDPYKILGVLPDAQIAEIRSAHRKLVLKCHPDKVQDPELKAQKQDEFQKVQQAYEILSDEKERQKYDENVRLAELRKQMQNKANISVSRASPKYAEYDIRTAEPSSSYKSTSSHTPNVRIYTSSSSYSRSYEDDRRSGGSRYYEADPPRSSRRETSYHDKPSKREAEKERDREQRDREKDRERRKRKEKEAAEEQRRLDKEEKKAREKQEKKRAEKQRSKEIKRETGEKRRETGPYIEDWEEDPYIPKSDKKKSSSSRKHDEKRERSSHRDDPPAMPRYSSEEPTHGNMAFAQAYISKSRGETGPERNHTYHLRTAQPPAVPTPPPMSTGAFPPPKEDDIRRSSARPRHGSGDVPNLTRERSYQRPSREHLDREDPIIVNASPPSRAKGPPEMAGPPPHISRTNTMPAASAARPIPTVNRANTFTAFDEVGDSPGNRGRNRNRNFSQLPEETESEDEYEPRHRDRKHRNSKKHRSPDHGMETRYHVDNGRTKLHSNSYSRRLNGEGSYHYDVYDSATAGVRVGEPRPSMHPRDSGYGGSGFKVKTSKTFGADDVQYSDYSRPHYREDYQTPAFG